MGGYSGLLAAACGCLVLSACHPGSPPAMAGEGTLVLELGGGHRSLSASLSGLGVELLPPCNWAADPDAPPPLSIDGGDAGPAPAAEPGPVPTAEPEPAPPPEPWFVVELEARQTLMHLAKRHLGAASRFKEIMRCNGWTEADARRLRIGTKVRIPRAVPAS